MTPPLRESWSESSPKPQRRVVYEKGRIPFVWPANFEALTTRALLVTGEVLPHYANLLRLLKDCEGVDYEPLCSQQQRGATYKQLAAIGHKTGMNKAQRLQWYQIAESVPLSCRHAGHILSKLKGVAE